MRMYGEQEKPLGSRPAGVNCNSPLERDTPEVTRAMADLRYEVERYDLLAGRLHDRLSCVTTTTTACQNEAKEVGYGTELAATINGIRCKLRDITNNLEGLYERIEL